MNPNASTCGRSECWCGVRSVWAIGTKVRVRATTQVRVIVDHYPDIVGGVRLDERSRFTPTGYNVTELEQA